jgi:hypothetical protein
MAPRHSLAAGVTDFTLTSNNSSVSINPNGDPSVADGLYNWSVDNVSQVAEGRVGQGFYISANGGPALPLAALDISSPATVQLQAFGASTNNLATVNYTGLGYTVTAQYYLNGFATGSFTSELFDSITITNTGITNLPFIIDDYTGLNLGGNGSSDSIKITSSGTTATQTDAAGWNATGVSSIVPFAFEASTTPSLINAITGGTLGLSGATASGPNNVSNAVEYTATGGNSLAPNASLSFTYDELIVGPGPSNSLPEPGALAAVVGAISLFVTRPSRRGNQPPRPLQPA